MMVVPGLQLGEAATVEVSILPPFPVVPWSGRRDMDQDMNGTFRGNELMSRRSILAARVLSELYRLRAKFVFD